MDMYIYGFTQVLSLVAGGELAGAPIAGTMKGYFGDLFDEGDENGSADLDFEEFERIMQIIAPSFEGALTTQCLLRIFVPTTHRSLTISLLLPYYFLHRRGAAGRLPRGRPRRQRDGRPA